MVGALCGSAFEELLCAPGVAVAQGEQAEIHERIKALGVAFESGLECFLGALDVFLLEVGEAVEGEQSCVSDADPVGECSDDVYGLRLFLCEEDGGE